MDLDTLLSDSDVLYTEGGVLAAGTYLRERGMAAEAIRPVLRETARLRTDAAFLYLAQRLSQNGIFQDEKRCDPRAFAFLAEIELIFLQEDTDVLRFWEMILTSLSYEPTTGITPSLVKYPFLGYVLDSHQSNSPILIRLYELSREDTRAVDILTALHMQFDMSGIPITVDEELAIGLCNNVFPEWDRHPHLTNSIDIHYGRKNQESKLRVFETPSLDRFQLGSQKIERMLDWIEDALSEIGQLVMRIDPVTLHGKRITLLGEAARFPISSYRIDTSENDLSLVASGGWKYGTFCTALYLEIDAMIAMVDKFRQLVPHLIDIDRIRHAYSLAISLCLLQGCNLLASTGEQEVKCDPLKIIPDQPKGCG